MVQYEMANGEADASLSSLLEVAVASDATIASRAALEF
jgi:hypothetical protein